LTLDGREVKAGSWVYIGSFFSEEGRFMAEGSGVLVGFVHDPMSVVEHREGLGIGRWGSVAGNADLAPPVGTPIWLTVINIGQDEETVRDPANSLRGREPAVSHQ
jgi:hypothetical protein